MLVATTRPTPSIDISSSMLPETIQGRRLSLHPFRSVMDCMASSKFVHQCLSNASSCVRTGIWAYTPFGPSSVLCIWLNPSHTRLRSDSSCFNLSISSVGAFVILYLVLKTTGIDGYALGIHPVILSPLYTGGVFDFRCVFKPQACIPRLCRHKLKGTCTAPYAPHRQAFDRCAIP